MKHLEQAFYAAKTAHLEQPFVPLDERRRLLTGLQRNLIDNRDRIVETLNHDFGKRSSHETLIAEVFSSAFALQYASRHLNSWSCPRRQHIPWCFQPAKAQLLPQARGVVGIISPWNYPIYLSLAPLASALAAGNRVFLKMSELTTNTAKLLIELTDSLQSDLIQIFVGDGDLGHHFAALPFDHLMFTGSTSTGIKVMKTASHHLTSITLELGGKSPVVIAADADISKIIDRISFGKLFNAGQTCIAPDYGFVHESKMDEFVRQFQQSVRRLYPSFADNPDYTAIISQNHFDRLNRWANEAKQSGCDFVTIGDQDEIHNNERIFAPVLLINPVNELSVMKEEIFGPIFPILTFTSISEVLDDINQRPHPLAIYLFSHDNDLINRFKIGTQSGALSINETLVHAGIETIPFGGVGDSGMGAYHGKTGFDTFSHLKPVFNRKRPNLNALLSPPFGKIADRIICFLLKQ